MGIYAHREGVSAAYKEINASDDPIAKQQEIEERLNAMLHHSEQLKRLEEQAIITEST